MGKKRLKFKDRLILENYYINNPLKFSVRSKLLRDFSYSFIELTKIFLGKLGFLKYYFNERLLERPFVFDNLPKKSHLRILDIGCSDSIMPIEFAAMDHESYGNDIKIYPYKYPGFKFIRGDILDLPYQGFFDVVTCISVLEHIGLDKDYSNKTKDRKDKLTMLKINNMLKNKGILILTVPFGTRKILKSRDTRIYDSKELSWIFEGFKKKEELYYYFENNFWKKSNPKTLENLTKNKDMETVAMFVLEKK